MTQRTSPLTEALKATAPALGATFVLSLFINLTLLVSPLYSMQVYDRVLSSRNVLTLLMLTLIVVGFMVLYGILEYCRSGVLIRAGVAFENRVRRPLFEAMMQAELDPQHRQGPRVIRDAETIRDCLANGTATVVCDLPWVPAFVVLCYMLHFWLGCVAVGGAVVLFSLALITELATKESVEATTKLSNEAFGFVLSALRNGEVVRGLGMGETMLERWCRHQCAATAASARSCERGAILLAASKFARIIVQTTLLGVGAWLAINHEISPGVMMAASIVMGRALAPIEQAVAHWKRILNCRASYGRLRKLFNATAPAATATELPEPVGHLAVEGITVSPPGSSAVSLKNLSFRLAAGESLAVVGASGSGKSSLARALIGIWSLAAGDIRIDGASLSQWDANKLGKQIGYLPQDVELFSGTVAENIARLGKVDSKAVVAAAQAAGAHEAILRLPKGYDTPIGDSGYALSGGMRQRVGLARALYGDPRVVLLDEPNSNLDDEGERALARALAHLKAAGRTVIVVTHRPHILAHVDKLLVLSFGSAIAFGSRDEVVARMRGNKVAAVASPPQTEAAA
jgi:ATP-binding cassette, subfamily C, type I secretion system permease/ATPase